MFRPGGARILFVAVTIALASLGAAPGTVQVAQQPLVVRFPDAVSADAAVVASLEGADGGGECRPYFTPWYRMQPGPGPQPDRSARRQCIRRTW